MKNTWAGFACILYCGLCGCGAKWNVSGQEFFRYQNQDVRIAGMVEMTGKAHQIVGGEKGSNFYTRLYSDDYSTIIYETQQRLGDDLESSGDLNTNEIFTIPITAVRLGGTSNSYPMFCAEIKMDDSNVSDWTRVGCVGADDPPSESPTGGLGQTPSQSGLS